MIERTTDASAINAILNHPQVRPYIADIADGYVDVGKQLAAGALALAGEYGAFMVYRYDVGIYECHTAVLPAGRGAWALAFAKAGATFMFTQTDCVEIMTRVPQGHVAAKALSEAVGFRHQFTTPPDCLFRGKAVPCHIYAMPMAEWFSRAEGLEAHGAAFHRWLNAQVGNGHGEPHPADPGHNKVIGAALAMVSGGQVAKGIAFYNKNSIAARHATISLLSLNPPQIRFDAGVLTMTPDGLRFERSH